MTTGNPSHSREGQQRRSPQRQISRRSFIRLSAAGALVSATGVPLLLSACGPQAQAPPAGPVGEKPAGAGPSGPAPTAATTSGQTSNPLPTYIPFAGGAKPDYHLDDPRYDDGFETFPSNPFKAVPEPPGRGSAVNVLIANYFPPPTPFEQNPAWQEINKQLNANVQMSMASGADYRAKFTTTIAGDDFAGRHAYLFRLYAGPKPACLLQGEVCGSDAVSGW